MNAVIDNDSGIAIPEETRMSIAAMKDVSAGLEKLKKQYSKIPDVSTDEGYALAKKERKSIGDVRIKVEKAHKAGKAFYLEGGRTIDKMKNDILKTVTELEEVRKEAIKAVDDEKARIEQEAAEKEQARIEEIESRIARIMSAPSDAVTLDQVKKAIEMLSELRQAGTYDDFGEFKEQARSAIEESDIALNGKLKALEAQAAEAEKLERQRMEQERIAAEQKAAQDKIDLQQRELEEAKQAESRRAAIADAKRKAAAKAEREKKEQAERAEREKAEAVEAAKVAEQKRLKAEQEAEAKRISDEKAEKQRIAELAPDADKLRKWLDSIPEMTSREGVAASIRIRGDVESILDLLDNGRSK